MKTLTVTALVIIFVSLMASAKDAAKKIKKNDNQMIEVQKPKKESAPCETKEDILKKLEEEKKARESGEKPKAFSLQGGNTGCSVK